MYKSIIIYRDYGQLYHIYHLAQYTQICIRFILLKLNEIVSEKQTYFIDKITLVFGRSSELFKKILYLYS